MQQPLHFGVTPWRQAEYAGPHSGAGDLVDQACRAEQLGYASFWLPESHFSGAGAIPEPLMWLAAVAAATTRIRLATTSYLLPLRHPVQAAEQVAVLDQLSRGRVILGVGRGFQASLFQAFDQPVETKRERFESCLNAMREAWDGKALAEATSLPVTLAPRPVQRPHPPIWAAAFGPKAIEQAARLGLPYLASPVETLAHLQDNYQHYDGCRQRFEQQAPGAGGVSEGHSDEPTAQIVPVMRTVFVSSKLAEVRQVEAALKQQIQQLQSRGTQAVTRAGKANVRDWALLGNAQEVAEQIENYRQRLGMTHLIVTRLRLNSLPVAMLESSVERTAALMNQF